MTALLHKNLAIGFFSLIFGTLTLCPTQASAQTFDISGIVSSSSNPIRSAWLSFANNADTTQKFYALTGTLGHYQVNVVLSSIIEGGSLPANVDITAYKEGSKTVIVAVNRNATPVRQTFSIPDGTMASFTPYVTSASKSCLQSNIVPFSNGQVTFTLEASSVVTLVGN